MRKTLLSIIFILILLLVPTMVFAAEGDIAQVGEETFADFEDALEAAKASGEDLVILETLNVGKNATINIEGVNITGEVNPLITVNDGYLTIEGNGTIAAPNGDAFSVLGNYGSDYETVAISSGLKIGADVKVIARDNCIYIRGNAAKADIYGSLTSTKEGCAVIQGNGNASSGKTVINIYDGANVVHNDKDVAIYNPQPGKVNVYGGTIKGATGIEMRAGELVVEGGTIIGTHKPVDVTPNGNGSTSFGAGIAIAQHNTKLDTSVVVNGGTIQGFSAVYESNPEKNPADALAKVSIELNGGKFEAINEGTVSIYSENKKEFIYEGTFSTTVNEAYLAEGVTVEKDSNGNYVAGTRNDVVIHEVENGTVTVDKASALAGETITITATAKDGYQLKSLKAYTAAESEITVTNGKFVMPNIGAIVVAEFEKIPEPVQPEEEVDYIIPDVSESESEEIKEIINSAIEANEDLVEKITEAIDNGEKVTVAVEVEKIEKDTVKDEDKEMILQEVKANQKVHQYLDISVVVKTEDSVLGTVPELSKKIKLSVEISEDLIKEGRKFFILKLHNGEVYPIQATLNGTKLEFETNQFSIFALAYEDVETTGSESGEQQITTEKDETPKTGAINITVYACISIAVMAVVGIATTKKSSKHSK